MFLGKKKMEMLIGKSKTAESTAVVGTEEGKSGKTGIWASFVKGLAKTRDSITNKFIALVKFSNQLDDNFYDEIETILIQADMGVDTTMHIVDKIRLRAKKEKFKQPEEVIEALISEIKNILGEETAILNQADQKPTVIMVVGVNGAGKTTSIAKLTHRFQQEGREVLLAAADTFRAAAIDQLQVWANRLQVELIKHQPGSDPAAVAFDAYNAAVARKADVLIIDTAGRLQNKKNLMNEISKIRNILGKDDSSAPHEVLLALDATTGQNAVTQAREFMSATGITGIILTKLDGTAKGGVVVAIAHELKVPVKLVGIGESMEDLQDFSPIAFAEALFNA